MISNPKSSYWTTMAQTPTLIGELSGKNIGDYASKKVIPNTSYLPPLLVNKSNVKASKVKLGLK